jgi:8-oxo-dGTP pyrophosphatase MutT (NUDIX family)
MSPAPPDRDTPLRAPGTRAVRPRHAATLILIRRDGPEPRLLMGRRAGGHDFMPNKWVFPGGRVDRCDFTAPAASDLQPAVQAALSETAPARLRQSLPRALAMAAVRETFEEAGLLLARPHPVRPAVGGWRAFLAAGAAADLAALTYLGRAVTPYLAPKRFDARFFMADAAALMSLERAADTGELGEIDWFTLEDAAALDLPTVTRMVIREVGERLTAPDRPPLSILFRPGQLRRAVEV